MRGKTESKKYERRGTVRKKRKGKKEKGKVRKKRKSKNEKEM